MSFRPRSVRGALRTPLFCHTSAHRRISAACFSCEGSRAAV